MKTIEIDVETIYIKECEAKIVSININIVVFD